MRNLNPTLWRTCRVLSGENRIKLLRQIHDHPGQAVSELALAVGIGRSAASQELRRIQSRGLLRAERKDNRVVYRMEADPQVPSAAPLLKALNTAFSSFPPARDGDLREIAFGLAYPRRIAIAQMLQAAPQSDLELCVALNLSSFAVFTHARTLQKCGWVKRVHGRCQFTPPAHPLAHALVRLLRDP